MISGIYEIVNTVNGARYIGSATRMSKRFSAHRCYLRKGNHHSYRLQRAWDKYGEAVFEFRPILMCTTAELLLREQWAVDTYRPGYNIAAVAGNAMRGRHHSPETKARISASTRGRTCTAATRARISAAGIGRPQSAESRRKRSIAMQGNKYAVGSQGRRGAKATPATRLRLSNSHMGKSPTPETRRRMSAGQVRAWVRRKAAI